MATHLFLFIHDVLYAHIRQHKIVLHIVFQKKQLCQQKKIISHRINVAQQNYVSHKKICCGNKKDYVTGVT